MEGINQQAQAVGFRRAAGKLRRIKELGITSDMSEKAIEKLVIQLAEAKAVELAGTPDEKPAKDLIKGQEWFVRQLVEAAGKNSQELLDEEITQAFPDVATHDELVSALDAIANG